VDDQVQPTVAIEQKHPTQERLDDHIAWYDRKSQAAQRRYKTLKLARVIIAALIPLASAFPIPAVVNAGEKMHRRAGVKLHHGGMPDVPHGKAFAARQTG
jgi:hypothetical protein